LDDFIRIESKNGNADTIVLMPAFEPKSPGPPKEGPIVERRTAAIGPLSSSARNASIN
jgi:hypothetical protein